MAKKYVALDVLEKLTSGMKAELTNEDNAEMVIPAAEVSKLIDRVYEVAEKASQEIAEEDGE